MRRLRSPSACFALWLSLLSACIWPVPPPRADLAALRRLPAEELLERATAVLTFSTAGDELVLTETEGETVAVRGEPDGPALVRLERAARPRLWATVRGVTVACDRQGGPFEMREAFNWLVVVGGEEDPAPSWWCVLRAVAEPAAD